MGDAVDLVLLDTFNGQILAEAPGYSGLKPKDAVIVNKNQAYVVDCVTVYKSEDVYPFILKMNKRDSLLRIESLVTYKPFNYPDETEGGTEDG